MVRLESMHSFGTLLSVLSYRTQLFQVKKLSKHLLILLLPKLFTNLKAKVLPIHFIKMKRTLIKPKSSHTREVNCGSIDPGVWMHPVNPKIGLTPLPRPEACPQMVKNPNEDGEYDANEIADSPNPNHHQGL